MTKSAVIVTRQPLPGGLSDFPKEVDVFKLTDLYFTFRGKDTRRVKDRSFSRYPRLDDPDWSKPRGAPVTMDALAAWLAQEVGDKELAKSRLLSSNEFTGSQEAREYWAKYVQDHYDDLREYQLVKRTQPRSKLRSGSRTNKGSLIAKNSRSSRAALMRPISVWGSSDTFAPSTTRRKKR